MSIAASIGFLTSLGHQKIEGWSVAGLLLGGVVVAPIAAWVTKRLPTQVMGAAVGGMLVVTNVRTLLKAFGVAEAVRTPVVRRPLPPPLPAGEKRRPQARRGAQRVPAAQGAAR